MEENKLVPVLRDGINLVKVMLFKRLKDRCSKQYPERGQEDIQRLSGAVINELFGTANEREPFASFLEENRAAVEAEIRAIPAAFDTFRIALTDALRMQFLCDSHEGVDSSAILSRADAMGILIMDREVPLPKTFLNLIRTLAVADGILSPEALAINEDLDTEA
ncbi:MAG: hypothetical protein LJE65_06700 [Desulfobacteraceae bacterium]|nr:hypothetical protein [Desulfobacteraceae bacterium]